LSENVSDGSRHERLVTASEIAGIAGVSQSAVSNWRKRFDSFPQPAGTASSGGDLFKRDEVEAWLGSRKRRPKAERGAGEQLQTIADRLRGRALPADLGAIVAIAAAFVDMARDLGIDAERLRVEPDRVAEWVQRTTERIEAERSELVRVFTPLADVDPESLRLLLDSLDEFSTRSQLSAAVDHVLSRAARYGDFRTPPAIADLVVQLAEPHTSVYDPAAGSGEFLLRAAAAMRDGSLYGQELNEHTWRIAKARLSLNGVSAQLATGDSFTDDAFADLRVDAVLSEPPAGSRSQEIKELAGDRRWQLLGTLNAPPARAADFAWIAHIVEHLSPDGHAVVVLPTGSLVRGGVESRLRSELLRQGTVEGIITVPGGGLQGSAAPAAIWLLRRPTARPDDVLLIEADSQSADATAEMNERIIETIRFWRKRRDKFTPVAGFATAVPVLQLLKGDASLLPSRWLYEASFVDTDQLVSRVRAAQRALEDVETEAPTTGVPEFELAVVSDPRQRLRVRDVADVIRPSRLKKADYVDDGIPIWLPADIRPPWDRDEPMRYANPNQVDPRSVTEPGDIVITTIGSLRTRVDTEGGHVLGTSLHALRLKTDAFDPEAVAVLLTSEQNRRLLTGTAIPRVNVLELELPWVDPAEAAEISRIVRAIEREQERAHTLARRSNELRAAFVEAVATGATTLRSTPEDSNG
jgi:predicted DNA-binding transcriptional regulator AlpA